MKSALVRYVPWSVVAVSTVALHAWLLQATAQASGAPRSSPLLYAGSLSQDGVALDGTVAVAFELVVAGTSTVVCSVEEADVVVAAGEFRLDVSTCAGALRTHSDVDVVLSIDGERFPPEKVGAVPFALEADHAVSSDVAATVAFNSIGAEALATSSVGSDEIQDASVTSVDLQDGAVSSADIAGGAVDNARLANSAVDARVIAGGAVDSARLATSAVDGRVILDNSISTFDIADGAVSSADIADSTIGSVDIADGAVSSADIADSTIGSFDIADGAVSSADIADGTIGSVDIADGAVTQADAPTLARALVGLDGAVFQQVATYTGTAVTGPGARPFGIVDVGHVFPAGFFSVPPLCVVSNGDVNATTFLAAGVVGISASSVIFRAYSTDGVGLDPGASLRLNFVCVGR
jgi:hypothetical protein